jgi:hypothetical protein
MSIKITEIKEGDLNIAIFTTDDSNEPDKILDLAAKQWSGGNPVIEFIDANCNNPWNRIVISGLVGDLGKDWINIEAFLRDRKIKSILNER